MNTEIPFVILIGGKSKRFGLDKGLIKLSGKSFIVQQIETLKKISKNIFLSVHDKFQIQTYKKALTKFDFLSYILDDYSILEGKKLRSPLLGIYSSFKYLLKTNFKKIFVISCDSPLIKYEVLILMLKESLNFDCCIPRWKNGYLEPLIAIYPIEKGYLMAKQNLKLKKFRLKELLNEDWKINFISIENKIKNYDNKLATFYNINKEEDLEKLKTKLS